MTGYFMYAEKRAACCQGLTSGKVWAKTKSKKESGCEIRGFICLFILGYLTLSCYHGCKVLFKIWLSGKCNPASDCQEWTIRVCMHSTLSLACLRRACVQKNDMSGRHYYVHIAETGKGVHTELYGNLNGSHLEDRRDRVIK
jgi:hypothetical protein